MKQALGFLVLVALVIGLITLIFTPEPHRERTRLPRRPPAVRAFSTD